jgi:hypothetical protein
VLRPAPGKTQAVVYDYRDPVGILENAAWGRERVYGGILGNGAHNGTGHNSGIIRGKDV